MIYRFEYNQLLSGWEKVYINYLITLHKYLLDRSIAKINSFIKFSLIYDQGYLNNYINGCSSLISI